MADSYDSGNDNNFINPYTILGSDLNKKQTVDLSLSNTVLQYVSWCGAMSARFLKSTITM